MNILPRYTSYPNIELEFLRVLDTLPADQVIYSVIGKSVLGESIYGIKVGSGNRRVLIWSQMHGNESTATRMLLYWLEHKLYVDILKDLELYIIPVLNPDGATAWTRVNANGVDLNRDALELSQPESMILRTVFNSFEPHFCFNMHDQRSLYGTPNGQSAVPLSFLAPASDEERSVTKTRIKSMHIINEVIKDLHKDVNGAIGRYSDAFNMNCVGDYFMAKGIPTILFEAGHSGDDYYRDDITELTLKAFQIGLQTVASNLLCDDAVLEKYLEISTMSTNFVDILILNVPSKNGFCSLAVMYHEMIIDQELLFIPILVGINNSEILNAHKTIDLNDKINFSNDLLLDEDLILTSQSLGVLIYS